MKFIRNFFARRKARDNDSLQKLFFERGAAFKASSDKILEQLPTALEAITEIIEEKEPFKDGGVLRWGEVSLVGANTNDSMIVLVGIVSFPPGSKATLETGETVTVSDNTAEYFIPRLIRVGLPLNLAKSSKEEILAYLKKTEAEQDKEIQEFSKTLNDVLGDKLPVQPVVPTKKINDTLATDGDFDLSTLTEDQRRQLIIATKMGKG